MENRTPSFTVRLKEAGSITASQDLYAIKKIGQPLRQPMCAKKKKIQKNVFKILKNKFTPYLGKLPKK